MINHFTRKRSACVMIAALLLQTCGDQSPPADGPADQAPVAAGESPAPLGAEPGTSLAFEWSANGFEQVGGQYKWTGSGERDDVFQPNFSLSVPETDDAIWSSSCAGGGQVETLLYFAPPEGMKNGRARMQFETDKSAKTLAYPARYVAVGQYNGFIIIQSANDPMFAEMAAGRWAYIEIGQGADATKLRVSLVSAAQSLRAFLPACASTAKPARPTPLAATSAAYTCEDGRMITASYLGNDTDTPVVRLTVEGKVVLLSQTVSGSGARYEGDSADGTMSWLTKAGDGILILKDANDPAGSNERVSRCLAE